MIGVVRDLRHQEDIAVSGLDHDRAEGAGGGVREGDGGVVDHAGVDLVGDTVYDEVFRRLEIAEIDPRVRVRIGGGGGLDAVVKL